MSVGPGKYDAECTAARRAANAEAALLIVINGDRGNGFSAQVTAPVLVKVPGLLRTMADQIEQDLERQSQGPLISEECAHEWSYTGTAYGGDDERYHGEGVVYCSKCGADGDA